MPRFDKTLIYSLALVTMAAVLSAPTPAFGANDCEFQIRSSTMRLKGDCTTDVTIFIPDGMTLDGRGHTITAVDPGGDHFRGAVVEAEGSIAHVRDLVVTTSELNNVCDPNPPEGVEDDRLRGIMFDAASGSVTRSTVIGINQGASGCQEGNAIEIRNAPFDGTHPNTQTVEIAHNNIDNYQKTGIVANGDVDVSIHHNNVGASATQQNLAANSIQLGFGASGSVFQNHIDGNQWFGFDPETSVFAASAVLVFLADHAVIDKNNVRGNSDIGLWLSGTDLFADNNKIFDSGADGGGFDIGILADSDDVVTNNKVRGFEFPQFGVTGGNNKAIPGGPKAFQ